MKKTRNEFLPRRHPAKFGTRDKSNWKNLKRKSSWKLIDPAIVPLLEVLNDNGFKTFSSCSGGHKKNLHHEEVDHERGYIAFYPATGIVYDLYNALRKRRKEFGFRAFIVTTWEKQGSKRMETSQLDWELRWDLFSKRRHYQRLFRDMTLIVQRLTKNRTIPLPRSRLQDGTAESLHRVGRA